MPANIFTAVLALALIAAAPSALPSPTATPAPSPSARIGSAAPAVSPQANGLPAGAHMALHCLGVGDALFRSADVVAGSAPGPLTPLAPPGGIDQAAPFVPVPLTMGAGKLLLRDGVVGPGYVAWRMQAAGSAAPHHDCELDVDDGSGRFLTRYAILSAQPVAIMPDPPRADGAVGGLLLSHTGIRLLNF